MIEQIPNSNFQWNSGSENVTIQELGSLSELIAAVATLATLIYLAIQIRANTTAVKAESRRGSTSNAMHFQGILGKTKKLRPFFVEG